MKKLIIKDIKLRGYVEKGDKRSFAYNNIIRNSNITLLIRWNAYLKLKKLTNKSSKVSISNRCVHSINKKRLNKSTQFSRNIFLKFLRSGQVFGFRKSSW